MPRLHHFDIWAPVAAAADGKDVDAGLSRGDGCDDDDDDECRCADPMSGSVSRAILVEIYDA